jgi:peroxiredoxin
LTAHFHLLHLPENSIMPIQPGQQAPDFTLRDEQKNKVTLSAQRGKKVVLLFYPLDFTSTCTKELCFMRDNLATYNNLNAQVYGISVDSLYSHDKFKKEQNLNFPLLSDFNKEVSTAYDTIYETFSNDMRGVSKRSAFVIDTQGIVRYAEVLENAGDIPDFEAIQRCLEEIN